MKVVTVKCHFLVFERYHECIRFNRTLFLWMPNVEGSNEQVYFYGYGGNGGDIHTNWVNCAIKKIIG